MSRRFGRNQRRKMREEIALLSMLHRQARASLESESEGRLKERRKRLQLEAEVTDWAQRIVALLGPESAFARELTEQATDQAMYDFVVVGRGPYRVEPRRPWSLESFAIGPTQFDLATRIVELFATTADVERDEIAYRLRFIIRSPAGDRALVMDERTLQTLRARGDQALAEHLMRKLMTPWTKERGR